MTAGSKSRHLDHDMSVPAPTSNPTTTTPIPSQLCQSTGCSSYPLTSQLPVENWHAVIGDPTLADAILDRLVHNAYQLNLRGESMRKTRGPLNQTDHFTP